MTRVLSIWLPYLAIERWTKSSDFAPENPVVLTIEGAHGLVIHAVTNAAAERGATAGARLTDARALDPALVAIAADPEGDVALLRRLAKWASRWSPLVEVDGPDGLRLDVTGVAHLFGDEEGLVSDVQRRFAALGLTTRMAIAPTAAAAWALARFRSSQGEQRDSAKLTVRSSEPDRLNHSPYPFVLDKSQLVEQLSPLHVSSLRLRADTVRTLERLGLKTIGALINVPRLALARRFRSGDDVVEALDRALGRKAEPLTAAPAEPPPRATLRLQEPATHPGAASQALERLIPTLICELQKRHLGARRLSLTGYRVNGSIATSSVATAISSREPKHLQRLLADKAATLDPEFGFDAFALVADWTEDLSAAQQSLVEEPSGTHELARLIDRLTVKLGPSAVRRPQRHESHLPERANRWVSAVDRHSPPEKGSTSLPSSPGSEGKVRPQRLLDRPEAIDVIYATPEGMPRRFVWRRSVHDIARVEGPERIAPEWWRQPSSTRLRDYYRVEDVHGRRYWIYREGWIGDGRGGAPNWFIHGLFG